MGSDCIRVSEAIWDFARDGVVLSEEELSHIRLCTSCATILAEARTCVEALNCLKPHPTAPDCRSAAMGRISRRRSAGFSR